MGPAVNTIRLLHKMHAAHVYFDIGLVSTRPAPTQRDQPPTVGDSAQFPLWLTIVGFGR